MDNSRLIVQSIPIHINICYAMDNIIITIAVTDFSKIPEIGLIKSAFSPFLPSSPHQYGLKNIQNLKKIVIFRGFQSISRQNDKFTNSIQFDNNKKHSIFVKTKPKFENFKLKVGLTGFLRLPSSCIGYYHYSQNRQPKG